MFFVRLLRNELDYPLRQLFRWRRRGLRLTNEPKDDIFAELKAEQRTQAEFAAARLLQEYRLDYLLHHSTRRNYRENLYYLELMEKALERAGVVLPDSICVADIGVSHWFYVQAYCAFLRWWRASPSGRSIQVLGYEVDPYRVYFDFFSRYDYAMAHLQGLEDASYIPCPFDRQAERFDLISLFFPFVFKDDHLKWGLPNRLFQPDNLLGDVWDSLKPGGVLLVVNQGEAEHREQRRLFEQRGIRSAAGFQFESLVFEYKIPRYVLVAVKENG
ncbi:MAG: hypothetical protein HPY45_02505 [Anaerolineae bacterium]|nr:hypothetical protein [Anaerolineae bacterium]